MRGSRVAKGPTMQLGFDLVCWSFWWS